MQEEEQKKQRKTNLTKNYGLPYTVISAILQVADLPKVETDPRDHLNTSCH